MEIENKKLISIVTPCYNEEENIYDVYSAIKNVFIKLPNYNYEHIFIDNSSTDGTVSNLKEIANADKNVKIIVNTRNFGHIRSPHHAILQAKGDAVSLVFADLQEPPELIAEFIKKWEEGNEVVIGIKNKSKESKWMFLVRKLYYVLIEKFSETEHIRNFDGFGLYGKNFIKALKKCEDPYPYFRGLVSEIGFDRAEINYVQAKRKKGKTKNNFYTLYDMAMLGFVNHSKIPLRMASFIGFGMSVISFVVGIIYLIYKLLFWDRFDAGLAPIIIGIFFLSSVQLFFIGIVGEYIGAIYTQTRKRPLVFEKERINFD